MKPHARTPGKHLRLTSMSCSVIFCVAVSMIACGVPEDDSSAFLEDESKADNEYKNSRECQILSGKDSPEKVCVQSCVDFILSGESSIKMASDIEVDRTYQVEKWNWVTIAERINVNYSNGSSFSEFGDTCGVEKGGIVTILGFDPCELVVLARYTTTDPNVMGTPCPNGTVFLTEISSLKEFIPDVNSDWFFTDPTI